MLFDVDKAAKAATVRIADGDLTAKELLSIATDVIKDDFVIVKFNDEKKLKKVLTGLSFATVVLDMYFD